MQTIDIAAILSPDLKSRLRAQDLKLLIENSGAEAVELDFRNVKFATRSFMDEFYNLLLKDPKASPCKVTITNVPEDLKAMLDAVSRTQVQAKVIPSNTPEVDFKTVDEMVEFLSVAR